MDEAHLNMIIRQIAAENCIDKAIEMLNRAKKENHYNAEAARQLGREQYYERDYVDRIFSEDYPVPIDVIAADYNMTVDEMNELMRKLDIQYKFLNEWSVYAHHTCRGYTVTSKLYDDGEFIGCEYLWTPKGRLFLYCMFKSAHVYPTMERKKIWD